MSELLRTHSLSGTVIEIAIGMIVLSILLGTVALPIFFQVCTSTWGDTNIIVWGVVLTVAIAVIIVGMVQHFRQNGGGQ